MKKRCVLIFFLLMLVWQSGYAEARPVRIAVIDSGFSDEVFESEQIMAGVNYLNPTAGTNDRIGHGTAIAGMILGVEELFIEGIAPKARLVPLVIATKTEDGQRRAGDSDLLAQAIRDAIDLYECQIVNISAGTLSTGESLQRAVEYAEEKGVVLISSVGNDNRYFPKNIYYPAAYETVLGVSALTRDGQVTGYSQRNDSVSICAPGDRLKVASMTSGKASFGFGTSYATAYVSGTAALLIAKDPELTPKEIRKLICQSADDLDQEGYDTTSGWGALNVNAAIRAVQDLILLQAKAAMVN